MDSPKDILRRAGLPEAAAAEWPEALPATTRDLAADTQRFGAFWRRAAELGAALPPKPRRNEAERRAASAILATARASRESFCSAHAAAIYDLATAGRTRFLRLDDLSYAVAALVPGLAPTREQVAAEAVLKQADKDGVEIDQGILLAHILADETAGLHLCHAMLLPLPESSDARAEFAAKGALDRGAARLVRVGRATHVIGSNPRFLNAEDATTLRRMEIAVDVAILDRASDILVFRGDRVQHPKYAGRHVFGAGINLTRLYRGEIPFLWFLERDMGYVHKLFRGVASHAGPPDDVHGRTTEKPVVAVVETFAIGGHCQALLVADYVLAAADAYLTLPARKEGIIPGFANLRLPRFTGDRLARQLIQYERRLECDIQEGRLICDEIAPPDDMDAAIERVVAELTDAGGVSAIGNRRAFRIGQEPLDLFRRYASVYAREQAYCHFSPALIANLERNWNAKDRRV